MNGCISILVTVCFGIVYQASSESICFNCKHLTDPDACKNFQPCGAAERCFKEVVETDNGTAEYNWGCASKQLCTLENNIAGRRKRLSVERCYECCDGNFCNFGPCQQGLLFLQF
ncbi:uncharacterized protein LOC132715645 [Ruditapes philippinarum]|uniref:uncharacterized protein LOC132715645 n=1 Tax=Ruditapes philippinarum TaxID=129788 RepID=UPI00295BCEE3|nr:uncharacterized protein LOC132715645 [Ruditapes philippinarum]